jgi:hypothetical protein
MPEAYTIKIFIPYGNPEGTKILSQFRWPGKCIAFPRNEWREIKNRTEISESGIYILLGYSENENNDLPTIYIGQTQQLKNRITSHYDKKDFWNWCYVFVNSAQNLNSTHLTWLECSLLERANATGRANLDNDNSPKLPNIDEAEESDLKTFLNEIYRILPIIDFKIFQSPQVDTSSNKIDIIVNEDKNTVVVPARSDGFKRVFLGENCWHAIRISGGMINRIKYIAAYQTSPVSAVTHYAQVARIESYGNEGKYKLIFSEPATILDKQIPLGGSSSQMQRSRYTNFNKLFTSESISDLF